MSNSNTSSSKILSSVCRQSIFPRTETHLGAFHFLQTVRSNFLSGLSSFFSLNQKMATATAVSLTLPITAASPISQKNACKAKQVHGLSLWSPKKASCPNLVSNGSRIVMHASQKEQSLAGLTTLALAAAMVIPEIAEAAGPGVSPSLKNFLLSIVAGGVVVTVIGVAVLGVSNFDPVKRS